MVLLLCRGGIEYFFLWDHLIIKKTFPWKARKQNLRKTNMKGFLKKAQ